MTNYQTWCFALNQIAFVQLCCMNRTFVENTSDKALFYTCKQFERQFEDIIKLHLSNHDVTEICHFHAQHILTKAKKELGKDNKHPCQQKDSSNEESLYLEYLFDDI